MSKAVRDKAIYIIRKKAEVGEMKWEWLRDVWLWIKRRYWIHRVNRMTEGEIIKVYYSLIG